MSDDIRVYWDEELDEYLMSIGNEFCFLENAQHDNADLHWWSSRVGWLVPSGFELVYDSAEDEDYSLIDENLVVPMVLKDMVIGGETYNRLTGETDWPPHMYTVFWEAVRVSNRYHEERTA